MVYITPEKDSPLHLMQILTAEDFQTQYTCDIFIVSVTYLEVLCWLESLVVFTTLAVSHSIGQKIRTYSDVLEKPILNVCLILCYRFRLSARCIAAFILAQLPQDGQLRMLAHDAGAINQQLHASQNQTTPRPSGAAKEALKALDAAIGNKGYSSLKAYGQSIKLIILDPTKTITDSPWLVSKLVTDLFTDFHCLDLLRIK